MKQNNILSWFSVLAILLVVFNGAANAVQSKNPVEVKIDSLLSVMTLEEKVGQLVQYAGKWEMTGPVPEGRGEQELLNKIKNGLVGSMLNVTGSEAIRKAQELAVENSRLGIPMIFGYDVIHGYKTMFPIPLAETSSWDPDIAYKSSRIAAEESAAAGLNWTFAPMVDVSRDARWGRVMEGAGEDPYLGAQFAAARVRGFQGEDLSDNNTIAACAKHFAAYGFVEGGRDYNTVIVDEFTLQNVIFPPFKACVDAGVATFMNAFNILNGVPCTASEYLQRDILKNEWNFEGFVVSDWGSISEITKHGVAENKKEAALLAITAGSDMDMEGNCYASSLKELVDDGDVDIKLINDAVRRVLRVKFQLGLFDDPYKYCSEEREKNVIYSETNRSLAREVGRKSIVLLKNEGHILPLSKTGKNIAVIGQLAADKDSPLGSWRAKAIEGSAISLIEGVKNVNESNQISFAQGPVYIEEVPNFSEELKINYDDRSGLAEAVDLAQNSDIVVLCLGENCYQTGEGRSQVDIGFKGLQMELLEKIAEVNKNIVLVLMNGRPLDLTNVVDKVPAIVEAWHLGTESGNAIADVLFGDYNPTGKLPVSFPRSVGQMPLSYNHLRTGRPNGGRTVFWSHYTDEENSSLFPFGFGLSYTSFEYSDLQLNKKEISKEETFEVQITVKNTGSTEGEETIQLYIQDLAGSVARPVKELKGFQKTKLKPGESKVISFKINEQDLAFFTKERIWKAEPGRFNLWVGPNSAEGIEAKFKLID